jgi:hypothetical protein
VRCEGCECVCGMSFGVDYLYLDCVMYSSYACCNDVA